MKTLKVIIAGGGTGGHIFPALAIAEALKEKYPQVKLLFVGAEGKMEMERVPKAGYEIVALPIVGMHRKAIWKNWSLPFKLLKSKRMAAKILNDFQPDIAIGVGGFASFPILKEAQNKNIPTLIQEQNSYAGKTNKILGRKAKAICVAYDGMGAFFPKERIVKTGNPIRKQIKAFSLSQKACLDAFRLDPEKKTIVVIGGSLGAVSINKAVALKVKDWQEKGYQLIWQTGKNYEVAEALKTLKGVVVQSFFDDIEMAYGASTVIISRAGALACAELALVGKPVVFVPYPYAAENHQYSNAKAFVDANAAYLVKDDEVEQVLAEKVAAIMNDEVRAQQMGENMKQLALPNAEQEILNVIEEIIKL